MGPLEAAKALAGTTLPVDQYDDCWFCNVSQRGDVPAHQSACPWLAMDQIVRVLDVVQHMLDWSGDPIVTDGTTWHCGFCTATQPDTPMTDGEAFRHLRTCPWHALVAACAGTTQ